MVPRVKVLMLGIKQQCVFVSVSLCVCVRVVCGVWCLVSRVVRCGSCWRSDPNTRDCGVAPRRDSARRFHGTQWMFMKNPRPSDEAPAQATSTETRHRNGGLHEGVPRTSAETAATLHRRTEYRRSEMQSILDLPLDVTGHTWMTKRTLALFVAAKTGSSRG